MTRTQAEVIGDVRARLDDDDESRFDDRKLRRWINEICLDIARRTECLRTDTTVSAMVGQSDYSLPSDCIRVHLISYDDTDSTPRGFLEHVDRHNFNRRGVAYQSFTPSLFTTKGFPPSMTFEVYPLPSEAGTFNVNYYSVPTELAINDDSDADTNIDLPEGWHDIVVDGVEYKALRADRDPRWQEAKGEYEQNVEVAAQQATRFSDQPGQWGGEWNLGGFFNDGFYDDWW